MKHFFALPAVLRCTALLASASQQSFSVHDDLLAFPQYEVRFEDEWTSEESAYEKLQRNEHIHVQTDGSGDDLQDPPSAQLDRYQNPLHGTQRDNKREGESVEYEHMVLDGQRWLCRVPQVKKPDQAVGINETLSKAEEEKELARATNRGWELLSGMQDHCVFFISGWWSYRFCYNKGVKQFHQLPPSRGIPVYPPVEDPSVPGFTLGTYEKRLEDDDVSKDDHWEGQSELATSDGAKRRRSGHGELVQRGESRYLVQKLGGGTVCDLTGKERRVEVQFHCNPQSADRISLIKETSTCAYLMVIQTPRLCNDVAFLPPQKDQPNTVSCSPILREDEVEAYEADLQAALAAEQDSKLWEATAEAAAALGGMTYEGMADVPVGDIFVGERRLVPEGITLEKSAIVGGGKETFVATVATSDGNVLSKEKLEELGLGDSRAVDKLLKELEKIAKGQSWKLVAIDTPRGRDYRGIIGEEEEKEGNSESGEKGEAGEKGSGGQKGSKGDTTRKESAKTGTGDGKEDGKKKAKKAQEGSEEEYFKEEL